MVLPTPRFDPKQPIPNNPFYSVEGSYLQSDYGPLVIGTGLEVDKTISALIATGGGGGGGTVTLVATGTGLTGGPITGQGTIALATSGVTPGAYSYATINVDEYGRVRAASNGNLASCVCPGIVTFASNSEVAAGTITNKAISPFSLQSKISDSLSTDSSYCIASSSAAKKAHDKALAAVPCSAYASKGTLLSGNGAGGYSALPLGGAGQVLTACPGSPTGLSWATFQDPEAIPRSCIINKGTILVGSAPNIPVPLTPGFNNSVLTACSTCPLGVDWIPLSTVTPIPAACLTEKGSIVVGSGPETPSTLSPGSEGQYLIVCAGSPTGLAWGSPSSGISVECITALGTLISGTGFAQPYPIALGADGAALTVNRALPGGMEWKQSAFVPLSCYDTTGTLLVGKSDIVGACALPVGFDGQSLVACQSCPAGVVWADTSASAIPCSCIEAKGVLVTGTAVACPTPIYPGTDGQVLTACSTCPTGLTWASVSGGSGIPCACITGKGAIVTGTEANTPVALPAGNDNYVLISCSACTEGLSWIPNPADTSIPCNCITGKGALVTGLGVDLPVSLPAPAADNCVLVTCTACPAGITWSSTGVNAATPEVIGGVYGLSTNNFGLTSVGFHALGRVDSAGGGLCNTATGYLSLGSTEIGDQNTGLGALSLFDNVNGSNSTAIGYCSARYHTAGEITAVGAFALVSAVNTLGDTAVGTFASAGLTGGCNTSVGYAALRCGTTGSENTAVGYCSMNNPLAAKQSTAVGSLALVNGGDCNTAAGYRALQNYTCSDSVAFGAYSLWSSSTPLLPNSAIGACSLLSATSAAANTAVGWRSLSSLTTGCNNVAVGHTALQNSNSSCNVAVGFASLQVNTTGTNNVGVGFESLQQVTTGSRNTAVGSLSSRLVQGFSDTVSVGYQALRANQIGELTAVGSFSLSNNSSGFFNTAVGFSTLTSNSTGCNNTAIGHNALLGNTTGNDNFAGGSQALYRATGNFNTAIGSCALGSTCIANFNTAIGARAMWCNISGGENTAVGSSALCSNTAGNNNVALGRLALFANQIGNDNTGVGTCSLYNNVGCLNTAVGTYSLYCNSSGNQSTAVGACSLFCANFSSSNVAMGYNALYCAPSSTRNVAIGVCSAWNAPSRTDFVAVGYCALRSGGVCNDVAIGSFAAKCLSGVSISGFNPGTVAIGYCSLSSATNDIASVVVGTRSLCRIGSSCWVTVLGSDIGIATTTAVNTVAIGFGALTCSTSTVGDVVIGSAALSGNNAISGVVSAGSVVIGNDAAVYACNLNNVIAIGSGAGTDSLTTLVSNSNLILLGNNNHTTFKMKPAVTVSADQRYQNVLGPVPLGLQFVESLNPVTYQHCDNITGDILSQECHYGFSAQDMAPFEQNALEPVIVDTSDPNHHFITHDNLLAPMVNAIKELSAKVATLEAQVQALSNP